MIVNAYSIFDRKTLVYYQPWFQPTDGAASRILADLVNDPSTSIGKHPGDFVLFRIGTYDDAKGLMTSVSPLVHIMDAIALAPPPMPDLFARQQVVEKGQMPQPNGEILPS